MLWTIFTGGLRHIWCAAQYLQHQNCVYRNCFWTTVKNEEYRQHLLYAFINIILQNIFALNHRDLNNQ